MGLNPGYLLKSFLLYIQANGMVLEAKLSTMKVFYEVLFEKLKKNVVLTLNQKISSNLD